MVPSRMARYIWTYPAALLILIAVGDTDTTFTSILRYVAGVLGTGGLVLYIVDVIVASKKSGRLEL